MACAVQSPAQIPISPQDQERNRIIDDLHSKHVRAHNLGRQGEAAEAESLLRAILETQQNVLGLTDDNDEVLTTKNNLAAQLGHQDKFEEAETLNRAVLQANIRLHGPDNQHNIVFLGNLASLLRETGREAESLAMHWDAVNLADKIWAPSDPHEEGLMAKTNLAHELADRGDLEPAERLLRQAVQGYEKLADEGVESKEEGDMVTHCLRAMQTLASVLHRSGKYEEAKTLLEKVYKEQKDPLRKGMARADLGTVLEKLGKVDEAEKAMREGLQMAMNCKHRNDRWAKRKEDEYKHLLREQGRIEEAEEFRVESLVVVE